MTFDADYYFQRAKGKTLTLQDLRVGVLDLNQAVQLAPENIEFRLLRGDYLYHLDEFQLAIDDFTKVIESSREIEYLEMAYSKRALCHGEYGKKYELLTDLDWLIEHGFGTETDYGWRASTREGLGYFEDAINDYNLLRQINQDDDFYLYKRALVYYAAKRYVDALDDFTHILSSKKLVLPHIM